MLLQSNYKRIWWNWDMNKLKFGNLIVELPKSKLPASAATESGPYLFICSSSTPKVTDSWMQNKPAVVMGTGGVASVSYAEGEFSYSTDTWRSDLIMKNTPRNFCIERYSRIYLKLTTLGLKEVAYVTLEKTSLSLY